MECVNECLSTLNQNVISFQTRNFFCSNKNNVTTIFERKNAKNIQFNVSIGANLSRFLESGWKLLNIKYTAICEDGTI